jgi:pimeloyl-ACP methyl ester carboxylesterase
MFVTVNGVRLFFDVLNPELALDGDMIVAKPALICVPGGPGGDHQSLRPFFDRFSDVAQVIYLDPRASGRSERGRPEAWTLDQWGDDLDAFCEALGIASPILLGVSGGAMMVQSCLARHPRRAGGAVLINACSRLDRETIVANFERLGGREAAVAARTMYTTAAPADVPAFFQHCLPHYSRRPMTGPPPGAARATFNFDVSQHFFQEGGEAFRFDFRGRLGDVVCPVLAIAGAHDPVTQAQWARELVNELPAGSCHYLEFEDASHMVMTDAPAACASAVERFIREVSSRRTVE